MKKFNAMLDKVMRFIMAVAMFALLAGGTWQIFTRWILKDPSTVTDEFLRYVLIWAAMIGSAYCFYRDEHLCFDLFKSKAKGKAGLILNTVIEALVLAFIAYVFVYGGYKLTMKATNRSSVMQIPFRFLYSILPISGAFIVLGRIVRFIDVNVVKKG